MHFCNQFSWLKFDQVIFLQKLYKNILQEITKIIEEFKYIMEQNREKVKIV